jgi:hypothetical protein
VLFWKEADVRHASAFIVAVALTASSGQACNRGEGHQQGANPARDANTPAAEATSPAAERQIISLTGCLKRGAQPGEYALMSVATGGVLDTSPAQQKRQNDVKRGDDRMQSSTSREAIESTTPGSIATAAGGSSYRLIPSESDQRKDLAKYENQRVTVRGRLAADVPVGTTGSPTPGGTVVDSSATNATVKGSAPPLRGFQVESVTKVADTCTAQ